MTFWAETGVTFGLVTGVTRTTQNPRKLAEIRAFLYMSRGVTLWPYPGLKQGRAAGPVVTLHAGTRPPVITHPSREA